MGPAVEAAAEGDDPRPPGGVLGQLDGRLDRLRPGVREEEPGLLPVAQAGEGARQALVQLEAGLVVQDVLLGVDDLAGLLGDRRRDARMGVAGVRDPDPAGVVEVALAVDRLDPRADAALHDQVRVARPDRRDAAPQLRPVGPLVAHRSLPPDQGDRRRLALAPLAPELDADEGERGQEDERAEHVDLGRDAEPADAEDPQREGQRCGRPRRAVIT